MFIVDTAIRFQQQKIPKISLFLFLNNGFVNLFRAALYKLIFELHEDALFHYMHNKNSQT
jgi:hypothetical protein